MLFPFRVVRRAPRCVQLETCAGRRRRNDGPRQPPIGRRQAGMPDIPSAPCQGAGALLVETRADEPRPPEVKIVAMGAAPSADLPTLPPTPFTDEPPRKRDALERAQRVIPAVGGMRETGTTVIIEDVAFPIEAPRRRTPDCRSSWASTATTRPSFSVTRSKATCTSSSHKTSDESPARSSAPIASWTAVYQLIVDGYDGSLKAEHGTGRNMAPFVEREWGEEAYELMREIKHIFDRTGSTQPRRNPQRRPEPHLKNLKPLPAANAIVDNCTKCGFCERICPSQDLTSTPASGSSAGARSRGYGPRATRLARRR